VPESGWSGQCSPGRAGLLDGRERQPLRSGGAWGSMGPRGEPAMGRAYDGPAEALERYEAAVAKLADVDREGAANPYTSLNGHMFSFLDKQGVVSIRLFSTDTEAFRSSHGPAIRASTGGRCVATARCRTSFWRVPTNSPVGWNAAGPAWPRSSPSSGGGWRRRRRGRGPPSPGSRPSRPLPRRGVPGVARADRYPMGRRRRLASVLAMRSAWPSNDLVVRSTWGWCRIRWGTRGSRETCGSVGPAGVASGMLGSAG
jgi:hypothetical protein